MHSPSRLVCLLSLMLVAIVAAPFRLQAQDKTEGDAKSETKEMTLRELANNALRAQNRGDNAAAVAAADGLMAHPEKTVSVVRLAGDVYLRAGESGKAVECFDQYLKSKPDEMPYLWQRGIALYFIGKFQAGVKQFEEHRHVNPNDVENAAWHFLCLAKAKSFDDAEKQILPAPGDPRIPMDEVLQMLRTGKTDVVTDRVDSVPKGTPTRTSAEFYGDFYLGLYADAKGDTRSALNKMKQSAKIAPRNYMGDVARVYAAYLETALKKEEPSSTSPE